MLVAVAVCKELASILPDDWADYHDAEHVNDFR